MSAAFIVYLLIIIAGAVVLGSRLSGRSKTPASSSRISWALLYVALIVFLFFALRLWFRYQIGAGA